MRKVFQPISLYKGLEMMIDTAHEIRKNSYDVLIEKAHDKGNLLNLQLSAKQPNLLIYCNETEMEQSMMSELALSQLCSRLGFPMRYVSMLMNSREESLQRLVALNVNELLKSELHNNKSFLIRVYDGYVRAILSKSYVKYDSWEVLDDVESQISYLSDYDKSNLAITSSFISEEVLQLRIIDTTPLLTSVDEDLFLGVQLTTSDVGIKVLEIKVFLYKLACSNGLIMPIQNLGAYRQKHLRVDKERFKESMLNIVSKFKDEYAERTEAFLAECNKITIPEEFWEEESSFRTFLKKYFRFSEESLFAVKDFYVNKYGGRTVYDFANAITEYAQVGVRSAFEFDRKLFLEQKAGEFLNYAVKNPNHFVV